MVNCVVVDDDSDVVEAFCDYLETTGVKILAKGKDGADAVELYKKFKPDVLFVDLSMPKYDGVYAITNVRAMDPLAKIIVVTAYTDADKHFLLDTLKVNQIIYKPFNMHLIKEAVTIALLS